MSQLPMPGNLAWAPVPAVENIEVLDRFNGVPTLGVFDADGKRTLFWRAIGYVPDRFSIWLYVPVDSHAAHRLSGESDDVLNGMIFRSPSDLYVTIGVAIDYRLIFEREWKVRAGLDSDDVIDELLVFVLEALEVMLEQDLPSTRREMMQEASEAVRELAEASC